MTRLRLVKVSLKQVFAQLPPSHLMLKASSSSPVLQYNLMMWLEKGKNTSQTMHIDCCWGYCALQSAVLKGLLFCRGLKGTEAKHEQTDSSRGSYLLKLKVYECLTSCCLKGPFGWSKLVITWKLLISVVHFSTHHIEEFLDIPTEALSPTFIPRPSLLSKIIPWPLFMCFRSLCDLNKNFVLIFRNWSWRWSNINVKKAIKNGPNLGKT